VRFRYLSYLLLSGLLVSACTDTKKPTSISVSRDPSAGQDTQTTQVDSSGQPPSWSDMVSKIRSSIVQLQVETCTGERFIGSGFAIGDQIVTNRHVIEGFKSVIVRANDGTETPGEVIRVANRQDLAIVKSPKVLSSMKWSSQAVRIGDDVAVLGFPRGIGFTFTKGSISALDVQISDADGPIDGLIQTDAAVNPGNSGGPLVDRNGDAVGVVVLKRSDSEGLAFAIDGRIAQVFLSGETGTRPTACLGAAADPGPDVTSPIPADSIAPDAVPTTEADAVPPSEATLDDPPKSPESLTNPADVVLAFYDAVNVRDWDRAWELGGKNFGKNPNKPDFIKGYDDTISSDVAITKVEGNVVFIRLWATEQTSDGKKLARFEGSYIVEDGAIVKGKLKLIERQ
jgi:Trypsin-like peptidase domain